VLIAEGYATAASVHEATGRPVVVAFDAHNLKPVAELFRNRIIRDRPLVFVADDDHQLKRNVGVEAAIEAARTVRGAHVIVPTFDEKALSAGLTDFNDLHRHAGRVGLSGSELVRQLVASAALPDSGDLGAVRDLLKVNADLARAGNLLKLAIDEGVRRAGYCTEKADAAYGPDGKPNGLVQNFRDGDGKPVKWVASGVSIDANERAALKAEWEAKAAERRAELARQQDATAKRAWNTWSNAIWASPDHCEYLAEKGLMGHGVKMTDQGGLLVPVRDIDGRLHSLQYITRVSKAFLKNSRKSGCMHVIDPNRSLGKGPIIIAEGYATAASIHEATGRPVVTAFDAGNLEPVAAALRGRYPGARIVLAADDDHRHARNAGIEKAEKAAAQVGGTVIVVQLTAEQKRGDATDFDDLRQAAGLDAVKAQIEDGLIAAPEQAKTGQRAASVVIDATGKTPEAAPDAAGTTPRKAPPKRGAAKAAPRKAAKRSATKPVGKAAGNSGGRSADKRVVKKDPRKSAARGMTIGG
jgi:phage/plasmid primase-like uncharacterized protein